MEFVNDDSYEKNLLWLKFYMNSMIWQDLMNGLNIEKYLK